MLDEDQWLALGVAVAAEVSEPLGKLLGVDRLGAWMVERCLPSVLGAAFLGPSLIVLGEDQVGALRVAGVLQAQWNSNHTVSMPTYPQTLAFPRFEEAGR